MIWLAAGSINTDINEVSQNDYSVLLYPIPAKDYINLITKEKITAVELFSYIGQKLYTEIVDSKIDIHSLINGYYIIRFYTEKGIITKWFVKTN